MGVRPISTLVKYLTFKIEKQWLPYFQATFYFSTKFYPTYYIEGGGNFLSEVSKVGRQKKFISGGVYIDPRKRFFSIFQQLD